MRWHWILAAACIPNIVKANSQYQISEAESAAIVATLNEVRATTPVPATKMKQMSWNTALATTMQSYIASINPQILFETSPAFSTGIPGYYQNLLAFHITELPEFAAYKKQCRFWLLDTFNSKKNDPVLNLFKYRVKEALNQKCFAYNDCSTTTYSDYKSCATINLNKPGSQCAGAGRYYGEYVVQEHESFACAATGVQGPDTPRPKTQHDSFVCIVCDGANAPAWPPQNDVPYVAGTRASDCKSYKDYSIAQGGLCISNSNGRRLLRAMP